MENTIKKMLDRAVLFGAFSNVESVLNTLKLVQDMFERIKKDLKDYDDTALISEMTKQDISNILQIAEILFKTGKCTVSDTIEFSLMLDKILSQKK
jgi:hypothetical protein